mmetsp:Transcript_27350/g.84771  ORF Transcript_27350/g.84771 Transcript_27350/m.84771 type:complete len:254 (+) Transcript_27350:1025-1786(+)
MRLGSPPDGFPWERAPLNRRGGSSVGGRMRPSDGEEQRVPHSGGASFDVRPVFRNKRASQARCGGEGREKAHTVAPRCKLRIQKHGGVGPGGAKKEKEPEGHKGPTPLASVSPPKPPVLVLPLLVELGLLHRRLQDLERAHQVGVDRHDGARVVELVAVVRRGEDRDELALREELVAVLDDLVRAADEVEVVFPEELLNDVSAEGEADAAVVLAPADEALLGVGPQQVADEAGVGDVARAHDLLHLLHDGELG